jgi:hypothetical protein
VGWKAWFFPQVEVPGPIPPAAFPQQVIPLKVHLFPGDRDFPTSGARPDLPSVEAVSPPDGLGMDVPEVTTDGSEWIFCLSESDQLRVGAITGCLAGQHLLREQAFAPNGQQALPVQTARVQAPKSHAIPSLPEIKPAAGRPGVDRSIGQASSIILDPGRY